MLSLFGQLFLLYSRTSFAWTQYEHATDVSPTKDYQVSQNILKNCMWYNLWGFLRITELMEYRSKANRLSSHILLLSKQQLEYQLKGADQYTISIIFLVLPVHIFLVIKQGGRLKWDFLNDLKINIISLTCSPLTLRIKSLYNHSMSLFLKILKWSGLWKQYNLACENSINHHAWRISKLFKVKEAESKVMHSFLNVQEHLFQGQIILFSLTVLCFIKLTVVLKRNLRLKKNKEWHSNNNN